MKKIILSSLLLLLTTAAFGQLTKPVKIDSLVTVSLPSGYQKKDTLNQQVFSVNGLYGYMVVIRAVNDNNAPLKKEKDLNKVLKNYIKGIQGQSNGSSAQDIRDTTIGALKAKNFTLKTDDGNGDVQFRNFILLYTQQVTYTFEYVYPENRAEIVKTEFRAFAGSIRLSPQLLRKDQYLVISKGVSNVIKLAVFGFIGIVVIVILLVVITKRGKNNKS